MSAFKPLNTQKYHKSTAVVTPDTLYWKQLGVPTLVKEFGAVDYIDFNPVEPHYFAVTSSVHVQIYNPMTKLVVKDLSRFQEHAYGGSFRRDGRLLVAGEEGGTIKLFDTTNRSVLRWYKGHKAAVHRTHFTADMLRIVSFSDDKTVKLWDLTTEKPLLSFAEHAEYVRAGAVHPAAADIILSGDYSGKINMYDCRSKQINFSVDHGCAVESLIFLPTGGIFISAGGTEVRVWDVFAGGRLLTKMSQHHKTITCLQLASNGKRILSGSLDRHVKVYDVVSYQTVHTLDFPNQVLSLGIAPNDQCLVAGMVDGVVSIQNMEIKQSKEAAAEKQHKPLTSVRVDHEIVYKPRPTQPRYNTFLRKYEYNRALELVMKPYYTNKTPQVTVSVMQELIQRKGLKRVLACCPQKTLVRVLNFILRYISEHRFMRVLMDVSNILLDVYEYSMHEQSPQVCSLLIKLAAQLQKEVELTHAMLELQGTLDMLHFGASVSSKTDELFHFVNCKSNSLLEPSQSGLPISSA